MDYVLGKKDDGTPDPDIVLREDGLELRRAGTPEWLEYEAFLAGGGAAVSRFSTAQWAKLNANARRRSPHAKSAGTEPPLPPKPGKPPR